MIKNVTIDTTCSKCQGRDFVIDSSSGDTICTSCGLCTHDVVYDENLQNRHEVRIAEMTKSISEIKQSASYCKISRQLDRMYRMLGVNESFHDFGHECVAHIENKGTDLRGNKTEHVCMAIIYKIYKHFDVFCDFIDICKVFRISVKKLTLLHDRFFSDTEVLRSKPIDRSLGKLEGYIYTFAQCINIPIKSISKTFIEKLSSMPKSTKMKAAMCMYIVDSDKLGEITKFTNIRKAQLMKSLNEIPEFHEKCDQQLTHCTRNPLVEQNLNS